MHDAIPAMLFGLIQRAVGALEQAARIVLALARGHPQRYGQRHLPMSREVQMLILDTSPDRFGEADRAFQRGIGQQHQKFFATS